ncbi:MGMT family protein [Desulfomicrobium escambiense]|uniref:MGMT family protein n=1 Tax=Desulfomicrobium escambiense TaxID=29503 RepID=UPI00048E932E|nr:methylated-DNA--[protein]-cysteine S-methyltransferase [Desulfomicrobium escambiense]
MTRHAFTDRIIGFIRDIPSGRVATYGQIAAMAGNPRAARQVARILHACSQREDLPWHRVVNREGRIALKTYAGGAEQQRLLENEGVQFDPSGVIDLDVFLWRPDMLR